MWGGSFTTKKWQSHCYLSCIAKQSYITHNRGNALLLYSHHDKTNPLNIAMYGWFSYKNGDRP